jgi:ABC-2 type transport system permease protein
MIDLNDVRTIIWKELKELLLQRGTTRRGVIASLIVPIAFLGILMPLEQGARWVESPATLVVWIIVPAFLVATLICDSFAGERDRHTLETLLASRLSDQSILFGKIAAYVAYGLGLALLGLALGLITVNISDGHGRLLMFPLKPIAFTVVMSLLGAAFAGSGGVLISLRAATARQAQQTMSWVFMGLVFGGTFIGSKLPKVWKAAAAQYLAGSALVKLALMAIVLVAALDVVLALAAMARFQRAKLILD